MDQKKKILKINGNGLIRREMQKKFCRRTKSASRKKHRKILQ